MASGRSSDDTATDASDRSAEADSTATQTQSKHAGSGAQDAAASAPATTPAAPKPSGGDDWGTEPLPLDQLDQFAPATTDAAAAPAESAGVGVSEPVADPSTSTTGAASNAATTTVAQPSASEDAASASQTAVEADVRTDDAAQPLQDFTSDELAHDTALSSESGQSPQGAGSPLQAAPTAAEVSAAEVADGPFGPGSAEPNEDGSAPSPAYTIKGNADTMLFHTHESPSYEQTEAEVWFTSVDAAKAAMFRHWDPAQR